MIIMINKDEMENRGINILDKNLMKKKALYFVVLTFFFSYLLATAYYLAGGRLGDFSFVIMGVCYMFVPMVVAIILQKFVYHDSLRDLGISFKLNWWWLVAWILPAFLALLTILMSLIIPGVHYSPGMEGLVERLSASLTPEQVTAMKAQIASAPFMILILMMLQGLIAGITINAVAAFGEEFGWRGFLQKQYSFMGFWKMAIIIGIIWGLWHAPLIIQGYNYPQHPVLGVFMMVVFTTLFTPLISYVRIKSKSVIAAAIMHGTLNGTVGVSFLLVSGGNDLTVGIMGVAGFMAMVILNLVMVVYDKKISRSPVM
jgi:uncharacterized protein